MAAVAACTPRPPAPPPDLARLEAEQVPAWVDDLDYAGLDRAIEQSLSYLAKVPADRVFHFGRDTYDRDWMVRSLEDFRALIATAPEATRLRRAILERYRVYRSSGRDGRGEVLYTGYYEPVIEGCRRPGPGCRHPIYGLPEDLLTIDLAPFGEQFAGRRIVGRLSGDTVVPYPDRRAIEAEDALAGKAPVLAWAADPVDLFFLHIQGSGRIRFEDGSRLELGYRATNGRPYRSIGGPLIETDAIPREEMSMPAIKAYLRKHPERRDEVLNWNPSYVFFTIGTNGPVGSLGVPLTPGRSLATDQDCFPRAALAFVRCRKPVPAPGAPDRIARWTPFSRFMLNQDTGGAIRGPGRADLFWGAGAYAETAAGHLQHPGDLYFIVLEP